VKKNASLRLTIILMLILGAGILSVLHAAELDRTAIKVTASVWEEKAKGGAGDFLPKDTLDGDLKTSWRAEDEGVWIQYDLGAAQSLKGVSLAFVKGNERVYTVDVLVSATGENDSWTCVLKAVKNSGKSLELEPFEFETAEQAHYVRIVGHGNNSAKFPKWCNITEIAFVVQ